MKKLLLLVLAAAGGWWYFAGGPALSEEHVAGFYQQQERATLERNPERLCALLADDFRASGTTAARSGDPAGVQDKAQACESARAMFKSFEALGNKMGGILQLDSAYTVHRVTLSPDKKTATVDVSHSLDVAGSIMNIRSRSTDTLIRKNGKTFLLRSEGSGAVGSGS